MKVRLSQEADADVARLKRQSRTTWGDAAAEKFELRLTKRLIELSSHPNIGPPRDDIQPGLRTLSMSPFIIFYDVAIDLIRVLRVIDARRDYPRLFGSTLTLPKDTE